MNQRTYHRLSDARCLPLHFSTADLDRDPAFGKFPVRRLPVVRDTDYVPPLSPVSIDARKYGGRTSRDGAMPALACQCSHYRCTELEPFDIRPGRMQCGWYGQLRYRRGNPQRHSECLRIEGRG
jgi:hypothetical protein